MVLFKSIPWFFLLYLPTSVVFAQVAIYYTAYQFSFPYVTICPSNQYYDIALLQCSSCPDNAIQKTTDQTQCECTNQTFYYGVNQGGGSLLCVACPAGYIRSTDGFGCDIDDSTCTTAFNNIVPADSFLDGSLYTSNASSAQPRQSSKQCTNCSSGTWAYPSSQRCFPCANVTPHTGPPPSTISCCGTGSTAIKDGTCLSYVINSTGISFSSSYLNTFRSPTTSSFFQQHLDASVYLCLMNLNAFTAQSSNRTLLSNGTACQILANIAAMQFFYPAINYAYGLYQSYIWAPTSSQVWTAASARTSIPFLAYPSTYYQEINNASYNWIPSSLDSANTIRLKLAKYSPTGKYLGLFDAFDAYIQLCGSAYTDGKPAFTFGTQYQKTCSIRADALWNATLYETAFFDPYLLFTKSNSDYMLPTPVVLRNYITDTAATPNQNNDESQWVYHRRFFLVDRISGVINNNELTNIHYAKSITILNTLSNGGAYFQPPVIVIQYEALSLTDIGKGTIVEVTFETQYRMNLDGHIQAIWIAIGVLSGLGIIFALIQTIVWYSRAGKQTVDLEIIGKFVLFLINILGSIFFIVMAGVSLWWLIFFKREGSVFLVLPSTSQQASFTALIIIAFILKTFDIMQLIIRQAGIDIFFIDWEKPRTGDTNNVSIWRTIFVANEYSEIQTFRRVSVTLLLLSVLFFLKVINLENVATAQPVTILFPTSADYTPGYNGILRVGIAFSMWLACAVFQYLIYIIFYQRFIEDKIINFIDLCSVSNISIFILSDKHYGYYIHGRSPNGISDVNLKDMLINLERESSATIGKRGLEVGSDDQFFIVKIDRVFRSQYDRLIRNYEHRILSRVNKKDKERTSGVLLTSYKNLNEFFCAFIDHSLPTYNYVVRQRWLLEKILNFEFSNSVKRSASPNEAECIFYIDADRNFAKTLFAGYENSLFMWNMATFLFVDYFAFNYILAAVITYLLNSIAGSARTLLGQKNLSKKALIPTNFLN
ncbi:unnamed protein product [Rotaria magnacalcarata]|uniref:Meckelin n=2 Tax=Rotaria magnacalcarata TaxID=392030 RepID=A0A815H9S7_9BILA|nr:unnamed protein product [Rotaria magnacalcarata]CAF1349310.1 unnamed protein product [Rotaria magnacalcarata]CAF2110428.1 unnamed protein product [Rotaria magnacalcarata]CAF2228182.1 unnamed protein product [Rotaria magnacalcarata]CAF3946069.1 unnamed protein product [Rotaria magnacalcarata]